MRNKTLELLVKQDEAGYCQREEELSQRKIEAMRGVLFGVGEFVYSVGLGFAYQGGAPPYLMPVLFFILGADAGRRMLRGFIAAGCVDAERSLLEEKYGRKPIR